MTNRYPLTWNLENIFAGGADSEAFSKELLQLEQQLNEFRAIIGGVSKSGEVLKALLAAVPLLNQLLANLREAESFVSCLVAQDMKDSQALVRGDQLKGIAAGFASAIADFGGMLGEVEESQWQQILSHEAFASIAFNLNEQREVARQKLPSALETLASELAIDGYHGWGDFYNTIVSRAQFHSVDEEGEKVVLSAGQMANRLSDGNRERRVEAFAEWEREWENQAELCAEVLNRLAGFRLRLYNQRGWEDVLQEPLQLNRMSQQTLDAMWSAVQRGKQLVQPYLQRKAKLLGVDKLDWHDIGAPLGSATSTTPYEEGAAFIVEQFRSFDPQLADFSNHALQEGWIEAEDRAGKRPGGFCTAFPVSQQTRIFMTYSGTINNISTLAHELGHAYHQHVMNDIPAISQEYAMNVAETASTLAEMIVTDSALRQATENEERLGLLEEKLQNAVTFFMNIHARFLFEQQFYKARRKGLVSASELNQLMEQAQREAFGPLLGEAHPTFWASKLHFYLTDVPFYNFPYTFGYLFSSGLYAQALRQGEAFAPAYVALLRDTGRMSVEELAHKHLGVDLQKDDFWLEAVSLVQRDVEQFLELTK